MIFFVCCTAGLFHLAITLWLSSTFRHEKPLKNHLNKSLSIVVAARNEESNLKELIPKLLNQDFENFEIIVALDRCTDSSEDYLRGLTNSNLQIILVNQVQDGWNPKKYALNQAIEKAKNDWLVFTDADCEPYCDRWLKSINDQISDDTDIITGVSPYKENGSFLSYFIQFEAFMTAFLYIARALMNKPYMAVGRNMAIRKSFFSESKGYEPFKSVTGGDDDLFIQRNASEMSTQVMLGKESLVFTNPKTSWKAYWNQKIRHLSVGTRYKARDQFFLSIFHFSQLLFLVSLIFISAHAFFFPMLLFYLFIKLVSYRFAASKMEININYMLLPFVDTLYALLIPLISVWSKLEKDIKWKN